MAVSSPPVPEELDQPLAGPSMASGIDPELEDAIRNGGNDASTPSRPLGAIDGYSLPSTDSGSMYLPTVQPRDIRNAEIDDYPITTSELNSINNGILQGPDENKSRTRLRPTTIQRYIQQLPNPSQHNTAHPGYTERFSGSPIPRPSPLRYDDNPYDLNRTMAPPISNREVANLARGLPVPQHEPRPEEPRLNEFNLQVQIKVSKICGSGSNYHNIPMLKGSDNWAEWDESIKNAAMAEFIFRILDGIQQQPLRPLDTCSNTEWNCFVD